MADISTSALDANTRETLRDAASQAAKVCGWVSSHRTCKRPKEIFRHCARQLNELERDLYSLRSNEPSDDLQWLYDNLRLVRTDIQDLESGLKILAKLPAVKTQEEDCIPRPLILSRALFEACGYQLSEAKFSFFIKAVEQVEPLRLAELGAMLPAMKLALMEVLGKRGVEALRAFQENGREAASRGIGSIIRSLRLIGEIDWKETIEDLSILHGILSLDPAGIYPRMDFETREQYRRAVEEIAARSDIGEPELARMAIAKAESAIVDRDTPEALRDRLRHVGYYLIDEEGSASLLSDSGYRRSIGGLLQHIFRSYPDEIYIIGIEALTLITVVALTVSLTSLDAGWGLFWGAVLLILPASQAAVELMNYLVTSVLTPRPLPKLDFSHGVDPDYATMVAIPTLLINEKQIRGLVDDLEVRYLVNRDPNISFALLTDLPDSAEPPAEQDARVDLAISLIDGLNDKYADEPFGGFYLFHRHRVYNPREGAWMGWERKRGKLLDLNQLLRSAYDPFPVKTGDMAKLPRIRYVLTLDSDTQLPRGSAQKMIGAMAHPLNRALIDPELNIVTQGYGILQPRVGISVHSATRSRLAAIYSGQTGFDIYSRAVSDVYQDLYGEGIFTGKGIYDVDALRATLEHRFPRNALLSHDLIEGAYSRAGLLSDVEVIDDYPSHYSAFNRRKHRWLRGDWQIVRWILGKVPDESRKLVKNPISLVSRWKIVDNLRRSLVEPASLALLVAGWFFLPGGPRFWTLVSLALFFLPIYARLIFNSIRAWARKDYVGLRDGVRDFFISHVSILLNIAFLAHQALVSVDAIVRTLVRSTITHSRLLEWETATEAELGIRKRTPVDIYLDWVPALAGALALLLIWKPEATPYAAPFLIAWALSKALSIWINRSPHEDEYRITNGERRFLRDIALKTWTYYTKFCTAENNWLIPDNVQVEPYAIAERISPTNLGFLLNVRQAALEFGYITLSEFADWQERTLATMARMHRTMGHFLNWYDNLTLQPLEPRFVSTVDSGNLCASLWSLRQGCLELLRLPIVRQSAFDGLVDHHCLASNTRPYRDWQGEAKDPSIWLPRVLSQPEAVDDSEAVRERTEALRAEVKRFVPWLLPEYEAILPALRNVRSFVAVPSPSQAGAIYDALERELNTVSWPADLAALARNLRIEIGACRDRMEDLRVRLEAIADTCQRWVAEMDFSQLVNKRRNLLSIGFDATSGELANSCYDLLASEARIATFIAVAKGDVDQENWFRLGRQHIECEGEVVPVSWTGTMFEYLMAPIWMKSQPNTLLDRAVRSAVRAQQKYGTAHNVPWGISEAAYSKQDAAGNYQYAAFGVPGMALSVARAGSLVVSPYSSCLALMFDPEASIRNLRGMAKKGWFAEFGFYESADYTNHPSTRFAAREYDLVRCWMAHHQGMSLTAICNVLADAPFQRWFHAEPLVIASELVLQEKPVRAKAMRDTQPKRVLPFIKTRTQLRRAAAAS